MSDVRTRRVRNRISRLILQPGGITVRDAISRSEAAVDLCRESGIASLDAILNEMEAMTASGSRTPSIDERERLYLLSSQILDVAVCLRDSGIDRAAYALCDLIDICIHLNAWDHQCVEVHLKVLRLLRQAGTGLSGAQRQRMIDGLGKITRRRFGDVAAMARAQ